jgi:hypothetical protein
VLHQVVNKCNSPGTADVKVADRKVQALSDSRDMHLTLQHHVGVVENRIHRVACRLRRSNGIMAATKRVVQDVLSTANLSTIMDGSTSGEGGLA